MRIFHAHGASITKDWKLPIKLVCKACLPTNMTHHFSCGVEAAKCYFGQKVVDENDYVLIPNAIDVARFIYNPKIRNKIRKENNLENKHVVGHVGRFMAQKNHTFLMDVFAEVLKIDSQAHLVLLGDGELMDEIKRKTADLGISEHVTFVGNVGNANEWYQAFDCFVLPSIWEGLPVVGVEAQAADLPCVFSSAITREIGLSQRAKFVPLTESVSVWAKTLCDSSIKESVSLEPPAITSFLSVLTFLKASTRYRIPFSGTRRPRNNMYESFFSPNLSVIRLASRICGLFTPLGIKCVSLP